MTKQTYTKEEIAEVLREANMQISDNSANLHEKMMMFSGINIVVEALNIELEDYE